MDDVLNERNHFSLQKTRVILSLLRMCRDQFTKTPKQGFWSSLWSRRPPKIAIESEPLAEKDDNESLPVIPTSVEKLLGHHRVGFHTYPSMRSNLVVLRTRVV